MIPKEWLSDDERLVYAQRIKNRAMLWHHYENRTGPYEMPKSLWGALLSPPITICPPAPPPSPYEIEWARKEMSAERTQADE